MSKSNSFSLDLFQNAYKGPTVRVKLAVMENPASYLPRGVFRASDQVAKYFAPLEEEPREVLLAVHLDAKLYPLSIEEVSKGTLTASACEPRAIIQGAILANAAALILVHCHPSGDPNPSQEDILVTQNLKKILEMLPIRLLDHIIIGKNKYFSFGDRGLL